MAFLVAAAVRRAGPNCRRGVSYSELVVPGSLPVIQPEKTEVGSYFVATYPPFSVWSADAVNADARTALAAPPTPGVPLGLYVHIPFCRKRCHFCYFRVYTDKNANEVQDYLDVVAREVAARTAPICATIWKFRSKRPQRERSGRSRSANT